MTREAAPRRLQSPGRPTGASGPQRELREVTATSAWGHSGSLTTSQPPIRGHPGAEAQATTHPARCQGPHRGHEHGAPTAAFPGDSASTNTGRGATPTPPGPQGPAKLATQPRDTPGGPRPSTPWVSQRNSPVHHGAPTRVLLCVDHTSPRAAPAPGLHVAPRWKGLSPRHSCPWRPLGHRTTVNPYPGHRSLPLQPASQPIKSTAQQRR